VILDAVLVIAIVIVKVFVEPLMLSAKVPDILIFVLPLVTVTAAKVMLKLEKVEVDWLKTPEKVTVPFMEMDELVGI